MPGTHALGRMELLFSAIVFLPEEKGRVFLASGARMCTHHCLQGNPWSAYGETVIVAVQSLLIVVMLWAYDPPGTGETGRQAAAFEGVFCFHASRLLLPRYFKCYCQ